MTPRVRLSYQALSSLINDLPYNSPELDVTGHSQTFRVVKLNLITEYAGIENSNHVRERREKRKRERVNGRKERGCERESEWGDLYTYI